MNSKTFLLPAIATCLGTVPLQAVTVTVTLAITDGTQIRSALPTSNYGSDGTFIAGKTATPDQLRGLLSTSLSSIPAGATITSISLNLTVSGTGATANQAGAVNLELYQLNGTFLEGTGSAAGATPGGDPVGATWNQRSPGVNWTTAGGDFTTLLSTVADDPTTGEGNVGSGAPALTFSTSLAFVAAAQLALDTNTPLSTLVKLNSTSEAENLRRAFFYFADGTTNGPSFTITYDVIPEPAVSLLAAAGAGLGLIRRRRD